MVRYDPRGNGRILRTEWWLGHGCPIRALYGDDGEMQCWPCRRDFRREPLDALYNHVTSRRLAIVAAASREGWS